MIFDPTVATYRSLCDVLLATLDPTALNRVGSDAGTQYRHGLYFHSETQRAAAEEAIAEAQRRAGRRAVVTELAPAQVFWPAEEYHQQYLQKGGRFKSPQSAEKGCADPVRCYG